MTEFLLHIGPHKTGTTSIQAYLSRHRDRLLAAGVDFPLFGRTEQGSQAHRHFATYFRKPTAASVPAQFADQLQTGFTTAPLCILSAEGMYLGSSPEVIRRIGRTLGPVRTIVFYRRAPRDLIVSLYKESLKGAEISERFDAYVATQTLALQTDDQSAYFRFDASLAHWAQLAPITAVTFGKDPDLVEGFFRACDLAELYRPDPSLGGRANEALSDAVSWCLRMVNQGFAEGHLSATLSKMARKRLRGPEGQPIAESLNDRIEYRDMDLGPFLSVFHRQNPSFAMFRDDPRTSLRTPVDCRFTLADLLAGLGLPGSGKERDII